MLKILRKFSLASASRYLVARTVTSHPRFYSEGGDHTEGEAKIRAVLKEKFPGASFVNVDDISGGCGSMYEVQIEAKEFQGKRTVMQHRMVTEALKAEIENMHGLRISTAVPSQEGS